MISTSSLLLPSHGGIPDFGDVIRPRGLFKVEAWKPDGNLRWREFVPNGVTNLGFNLMLDSTFRSDQITPIVLWYIGLISNSSYTALAAGDTMASHAGWTEDSTHYTPVTYTGAVDNGGGYSAGATTMTIDGVAQAITAGTPMQVVGATGTYKVLSSVGGATPTSITFTPALVSGGGVADSAVITFGLGRPLWVPGAAASKIIVNASPANFPINTDTTVIKGIFVTSDPTLGGSVGSLWSTGLFPSGDQTLFNLDTLKITYQVTLT